MNIFPKIETLQDILPHIQGMEYIGVLNAKNGSTVLCYQISNSMSFATPFEKECRGITFDDKGNIIVRSMHKFFNVNEREESKIENIDWTQVHAVYDKMDGSMINTGFLNGELFTKSKKSFTSPVAVMALNYISEHQNYYDFALACFEKGLTPTFEYTSPTHRIVLDYKVEALTVLQIREMVSGRYLTVEEMKELTAQFGVVLNLPIWFGEDFSIQKAIETLDSANEMEGYVIQFKDGNMVKIKSKWYVNLHHAVTFVRERDIAELVLDEAIDDFIAFLRTNRPTADMRRVIEINDTVTGEIEKMQSDVDKLVSEHRHLPFKEMFAALQGHPLQGFVVQRARGKMIDYVKHYRQQKLPLWSLKAIDMGEITDYHTNVDDHKKGK
jgi:T4 RnlA family RNA ligase